MPSFGISKRVKSLLLCFLELCKHFQALKVGSCPNDENSVQFFICPFLCSF